MPGPKDIQVVLAPQSFHPSVQAFLLNYLKPSEEEFRRFERAMRFNRVGIALEIGEGHVTIRGCAAWESVRLPVVAPGGRITGRTTTVKSVFGVTVDPDYRVGLADFLTGSAITFAALTDEGFGPVFAAVPREHERSALRHFRVYDAESAFVAQQPQARQFADWILRRSQADGSEMPMIGVCEGESIATAATWFSRMQSRIRLPGDVEVEFVDRSAGRNYLVQAALAIGFDRPGWRSQVGLGRPPRFG